MYFRADFIDFANRFNTIEADQAAAGIAAASATGTSSSGPIAASTMLSQDSNRWIVEVDGFSVSSRFSSRSCNLGAWPIQDLSPDLSWQASGRVLINDTDQAGMIIELIRLPFDTSIPIVVDTQVSTGSLTDQTIALFGPIDRVDLPSDYHYRVTSAPTATNVAKSFVKIVELNYVGSVI